MSEIRALIEQLVAAGVDPIEAAEVVSRAAIHGAASAPTKRSAGAVRQERYRRNKASQVTNSDDNPSLSSPEVFPRTPFPKPLQSNPPSPPKGGSSPAEIELAFDVWDEMAAANGLATVRVRSPARRKRIGVVIRQHGFEAWREACRKVGASAFCRGEVGRDGWRADLDFVLQAKSFARILEGHYDDRPNARGSPPTKSSSSALADSALRLVQNMRSADEIRSGNSGNGLPALVSHVPVR